MEEEGKGWEGKREEEVKGIGLHMHMPYGREGEGKRATYCIYASINAICIMQMHKKGK